MSHVQPPVPRPDNASVSGAWRHPWQARQRDLVDWIIAGLICVASVLCAFFAVVVWMGVHNG